MMSLILISLLSGMVLGQRFKVLILLPAIFVAVMIIVAGGVVRADTTWSIALAAVSVTVALQIGYLAGTGIRAVLVAARASRLFRGPVTAPVRPTAR